MGGGDAAASVSFPLWAWSVFGGLVVGLHFLDLFVLHRSARKIPFRESLRFTGFWVAVALAFGGFVWYLAGSEVAMESWPPTWSSGRSRSTTFSCGP